MSGDSLNINRGTSRLDLAKGTSPLTPLESQVLGAATVAPQAEKDKLRLAQKFQAPEVGLSEREKVSLARLSPGIQNLITTQNITPAMPDFAKREIVISNLKSEINRMALGGVKFEEKGGKWGLSELVAIHSSLEAIPLRDRSTLTFRRQDSYLVPADALPVKELEGGASTENVPKDLVSEAENALAKASEAEGFTAKAKGLVDAAVGFVCGEVASFVSDVMDSVGLSEFFGKAVNEKTAMQRVVMITDKGASRKPGDLEKLVMHELAHQTQMRDGGWDPEKVKEFAKLSGWQEHDSEGQATAADGIDNRAGKNLFLPDPNIRPKKNDNFVDPYASLTPTEDYAESYVAFLKEPKFLMERAPEKLLYLNSQTRQYSSEQVHTWAKEKKVNLTDVATKMVLEAGLKTETMTAVCEVNKVQADKEAIAKAAQEALEKAQSAIAKAAFAAVKGDASAQPDSLGAAASALTQAVLEGTDGVVETMAEHPEQVIGKVVLASLSPEEKKVITNKDFLEKAVAGIQAGVVADATIATDVKYELAREGMRDLMTRLIDPKGEDFRDALLDDPQKTLEGAGVWSKLPDEMRKPLTDPANRDALEELLDSLPTRGILDAMMETFSSEPTEDPVAANLAAYVERLTPESFTAFAQQLGDKDFPKQAAATIQSIMETGLAPQAPGMAPMA